MSDERPFATLLATPGVEEHCELRGRLGFMAYHGGSLEEQTDIIAREAAERCGASYYAVLQPADLNWHIPSHRVSVNESSRLAEFVAHVDVVITVHGFGRRGLFTALLLGGQNRQLAAHVGQHLSAHLPAYNIVTNLDEIPKELRGLHPANPVNLPRLQGVQIELPPRVRGSSPLWADWEGPGRVPHTQRLIDGLVAAASTWPATAPAAR
jgi:phage replication-related protein YjqB (UPF0714/DUF867 family)